MAESTAHYEELGIPKSASDAEVRKAYRLLAMKHHPDKGGDVEKFREISKAYEVLSDPASRRRYDAGGGEGQDATNPNDIFSSLFGQQARRRSGDVMVDLPVTLEEIYRGCEKKLPVRRKVLDRCAGKMRTCLSCRGSGAKVEAVRMGAVVQQIQTKCDACTGLGKLCDFAYEERDVEIYVPRGAPDGHKIFCRGMADEMFDGDPGDLVFVLRQLSHAVFERKKEDLYVKRTISLIEALGGFSLGVTHLDGRRLVAKSPHGEVLRLSDKVDPCCPKVLWERVEDHTCDTTTVAEAATDDLEVLKQVCEKDLKERGLCSEAFVVEGGKASFKEGRAAELRDRLVPSKGCTVHLRMGMAEGLMYAVESEGMPLMSNPSLRGNLFLDVKLELPTSLEAEVLEKLGHLLPPPLNSVEIEEADECALHLVDAIRSYHAFDGVQLPQEEPPTAPMPGNMQCHQQ